MYTQMRYRYPCRGFQLLAGNTLAIALLPFIYTLSECCFTRVILHSEGFKLDEGITAWNGLKQSSQYVFNFAVADVIEVVLTFAAFIKEACNTKQCLVMADSRMTLA